MKKWVWLTVPAVAIGLAVVSLGGTVFAQEPGKPPAFSGNWTGMVEYCRGIMSRNSTVFAANFTGMRSYCQNATGTSGGMMNGGMMGQGGMMGNGSLGRGMMGW